MESWGAFYNAWSAFIAAARHASKIGSGTSVVEALYKDAIAQVSDYPEQVGKREAKTSDVCCMLSGYPSYVVCCLLIGGMLLSVKCLLFVVVCGPVFCCCCCSLLLLLLLLARTSKKLQTLLFRVFYASEAMF